MMRSKGRTRLATGGFAALATAALVGLSGPAYAVDAQPDLSVSVPGAGITVGAGGKLVRVDIKNNGGGTATGITVTIQLSGVTDIVAFPLVTTDCTADLPAQSITCPITDLGPGQTSSFFPADDGSGGIADPSAFAFVVGPASDSVPPGAHGSVKISVTSHQTDAKPADNTATVPLTIVKDGLDLTTFAHDLRDLAPGSTAKLNWAVFNQSDVTATKVAVDFAVPPYVEIQNNPACTVAGDRRTAHCEGGELKQSDGPVEFSSPIEVKVSAHAPGPVSLGTGAVVATGTPAQAAAGQAAALAPSAASAHFVKTTANQNESGAKDEVPGDNAVAFAVTSKSNPADLAVTAGTASGAVSDRVKIAITVKDNGPADSPDTVLRLKAPTGTEITDAVVKAQCTQVTAGKEYACNGGTLPVANGAVALQVEFRITGSTVGTDGSASISGKLNDPVPGNNSAKITITVTAGLPVTGTNVAAIGGVGLAVLAAGAVLFVVFRRRRIVLVTPDDGA
jgi:LPXTG-motif cell wall-anchored protein